VNFQVQPFELPAALEEKDVFRLAILGHAAIEDAMNARIAEAFGGEMPGELKRLGFRTRLALQPLPGLRRDAGLAGSPPHADQRRRRTLCARQSRDVVCSCHDAQHRGHRGSTGREAALPRASNPRNKPQPRPRFSRSFLKSAPRDDDAPLIG
jgi:hypothetical protein